MKNQKKCKVCGRLFACPPSTKKVTCSKECRIEYARQRRTGYKLPKETRDKISEKAKGRDMTSFQSLGTEAAKISPKSGRFETNVNAKTWHLVSPEGKEFICRNLRMWVREHCSLFGMEPSEHSFRNIYSGLVQAKKGVHVSTYKGWRAEIIEESEIVKRKYPRSF